MRELSRRAYPEPDEQMAPRPRSRPLPPDAIGKPTPREPWRCGGPEPSAPLARTDEGIHKLRANGDNYGDPYGGKPLHWMINKTQEDKNRKAVCPRTAPPDMQCAGRTSCDECPCACTYEGGTRLPADQREITWVMVNENKAEGGTPCGEARCTSGTATPST
ncbi:hypothetical protein [Streptomyces sp. NPDC007205]|uniref:hypothetical protein n=1 Tax=Streptomyces sp. NPDC007205 TaxID=3154316 RepID=UPI0033CA9E50